MLRVIVVDEAYNHYIDIYISNLCIFLLHPWSVVSVSPIIQVDVFCSLTSFNCDQCVQVFNLLMKFAVTIKDSPVHALSKTVLAQKEEEKFSFTFLNQFCSKFTNLLFDCLSTLKNFYILKLGGLLAYKPSTYTLLYYNDEFWCQPLKIYSVIFEWWTTFKGIFTQIPYNKAFDCSLPTKFEQLYPHKFMLEIVKEQVEKYLSTTEILNVHSLISYYHYIDRIQIIVLEKLENTSLSGWANSPIEPMILVESLKSEFSDVQRCIKGTLLLRACELSLRPVLKILKSMYFTSTPSIPVNFYKLFLDCLISIRSDCLPFSASLYQNIIEATFEQFYLYLVKNINLGHLSNDIRIRLYENVYIIKKIASLFSYKIDLENYGRVLMEINKEAAGSKVEAKAEKITSQWCNAISILSSTQIK
ncbi:hypothetical protein MXB_5513 [Myxobolus squamalis]|nr:hypothetical protein MXB_5513 [Myxobolus squamalis]